MAEKTNLTQIITQLKKLIHYYEHDAAIFKPKNPDEGAKYITVAESINNSSKLFNMATIRALKIAIKIVKGSRVEN